ncbi:hypothetical protein ACJX0J_026476, partial [Zea mays]
FFYIILSLWIAFVVLTLTFSQNSAGPKRKRKSETCCITRMFSDSASDHLHYKAVNINPSVFLFVANLHTRAKTELAQENFISKDMNNGTLRYNGMFFFCDPYYDY